MNAFIMCQMVVLVHKTLHLYAKFKHLKKGKSFKKKEKRKSPAFYLFNGEALSLQVKTTHIYVVALANYYGLEV